jgi:flagella basal body P-ring formation protein FlgA
MMRWFLCFVMVLIATAGISAEKVTVRQDALREVVTSYLVARASGSGVEPVLKRLSGLTDQVLPAGKVTYEVLAPQQWEGWGKVSLGLIIRVNDQVLRNLPLQAEVEGWRTVLVAARPLDRGEVLHAHDVKLERRDMTSVRGVPLLTKDDVAGKKLRTAVRQGAVLSGNLLEKVMVVNAGQQVTIMLDNDVLRATATGKAKGAGAVGDLVVVQNTASQKEFPARVVDAQTVRVDF